jgi:hypothetical protein
LIDAERHDQQKADFKDLQFSLIKAQKHRQTEKAAKLDKQIDELHMSESEGHTVTDTELREWSEDKPIYQRSTKNILNILHH